VKPFDCKFLPLRYNASSSNDARTHASQQFTVRLLPSLFVSCFLLIPVILTGQEIETPTPGKQVVQSVELPASTSTWDLRQRGLQLIGEPRPLDESKTDTVRYWLFLPEDYESQAESDGLPLLLFLHGAGERGTEPGDIAKVKVHGPPRLLDNPEFAKKFPCVTVSPQCKNGFAWSPAQLMLLLDHIEKNYKIDKSRVYVTGLSMGGFGTWMCLNKSPKRFAAAAPICGGAKIEWAEKLTNTPIWVFHGDKDPVVPVALSQRMVEAIKNAGGKKTLLTIYEGEGHDSWTRTYSNQLLFDWMLQHSL
jgi:predicted peptidase